MQTYFENNNNDELIVLLNGWGTDERPYRVLKNKRDILIISDFSDIEIPETLAEFDFLKYKKLYLIAYSAGVFIANYIQEKLPIFSKKISICGSMHLFEYKRGVTNSIHKEMRNLNIENALDFRKKLFDNQEDFEKFNKNQPLRSLESSQNELFALEKYYGDDKPTNFRFDKILVTQNDLIIPPENQRRAWENKKLTILSGGHFPFYKYSSLDNLVEIV